MKISISHHVLSISGTISISENVFYFNVSLQNDIEENLLFSAKDYKKNVVVLDKAVFKGIIDTPFLEVFSLEIQEV